MISGTGVHDRPESAFTIGALLKRTKGQRIEPLAQACYIGL
jgi:hypothetical protein